LATEIKEIGSKQNFLALATKLYEISNVQS